MKKFIYITITIAGILLHQVLNSQTLCPEGPRQNGFGPPVTEWSPPEFDPPVNVAGGGGVTFQDTNRMVFFIHGLGGTPMSWEKASTVTEEGSDGFPARKVMAFTLDYSNQVGSLSQAASAVHASVLGITSQQDTAISRKNYLIAHSQGGMVSRTLDRRYENHGNTFNKHFGGIVTFGTPHQGAYIGNSMKDLLPSGKTRVETWVEDGCVKLTNAFLSDIKYGFKVLGFDVEITIYDIIDPYKLSNTFCGFTNDVLNILPDFNQLKSPILDDYKLGATTLQTLASFDAGSQNPPHKVAFYGVKDNVDKQGNPQSIFFRTAQWFVVSPNDMPYFGANEDGHVELVANDWINKFENEAANDLKKAQNAKAKWDKYKILGPPAHKFWSDYSKYSKSSNNLKAGAKWLREVDRTWLPLIGAEELEEFTETACFCRWEQGGTPLSSWQYTGPDVGNGCASYENTGYADVEFICELQTTTSYTAKYKPSDGVVLVESQANYPGTTETTRKKMLNTSNMQMRNNDELKKGLNALYNGNILPFFELAPR